METCPFCDAEVSEELIRFGGACPTCFNAIPGEEAPTDPGLTASAEVSHQGESPQKGKLSIVPVILATMLIVAFALLFVHFLSSDSEEVAPDTVAESGSSEQVDIREENNNLLAESQAAEAQAEADRLAEEERLAEEAAQAEAARVAAAQVAAAASQAEVQPYVDRSPEVGVTGYVTEDSPDDSYRDPSSYIGRNEPDVVTGASAIRRAIRGVISDNSGAAEFCYSQQNDRNLGGTWSVSFIVNEDGTTGDIGVAGQGVAHEGLERCLRGKVHRWVFPAIAEATPYSKDYNFVPAL